MTEIVLQVCPICGKEPKVKRDWSYEASGYGAWCTIQCKPLFRKRHMKIEAGKADFQRAFEEAATAWNNLCEAVHGLREAGAELREQPEKE